jgi:hypothetical protein
MDQPTEKPSSWVKHTARIPLYTRLGFALIVIFGMVGNCAKPGDSRPIIIFMIVSILWCCSRILLEGLEAYRILRLAHQHDKKDDVGPKQP